MADDTRGADPTKLSSQMEALFTALALNRSIAVLAAVDDKVKVTAGQDEKRTGNNLYGLFTRINNELFQDRRQGPVMPSPADEERMHETLRGLSDHRNGNGGTEQYPPLFNKDGFVIRHKNQDELAKSFAGFYGEMRKIKPFGIGDEETLDLFMVALTRLPSYHGVYPYTQIDFRRLDEEDAKALHNPRSGQDKLIAAFEHALDDSRTPVLENTRASHHDWPNQSKSLGDIPFLSHTMEDGSVCYVTVNGGLVPRENLEPKHYIKFQPVENKDLLHKDGQIVYLPGTESLRKEGKDNIDGIAVTKDAAPLFCLDRDMLTGLRPPDEERLTMLMKKVFPDEDVSLIDLARKKNKERVERLMEAAPNAEMKRTVEIAVEHLRSSRKNFKKFSHDLLKEASAVPEGEKPMFIMSMGGPGAGKKFAKTVASSQVKGKFVNASLDKFREHFDLHRLLVAAKHQSDDYFVLERPANLLRDMVMEDALKEHKNLRYDGTGIDYAGRYDKIVERAKKEGYHTEVVAVDKPLPEAIRRVIERFGLKERTLPWKVTIGKHVSAPRSFIAAAEDTNLDKTSLFANDNTGDNKIKDNVYLVAENFALNQREVQKLKGRRATGDMEKYFRELIYTHKDSILHSMAGNHDELDALVKRIPKFTEKNVGFLEYGPGDDKRVLAIYNVERFREFMEKGVMNPQASYEEGLYQTPATLPHVAESWLHRVSRPQAEQTRSHP